MDKLRVSPKWRSRSEGSACDCGAQDDRVLGSVSDVSLAVRSSRPTSEIDSRLSNVNNGVAALGVLGVRSILA